MTVFLNRGRNQVGTGKRRHSEVDAFLASRKESLEREQRKDYWIKEGLVVKVLHSKLADGKYYKKKGVITGVRNRYTAEVEMLDSGDVLKLDQVSLETVIPKIGGQVYIVNGASRGDKGILESVDFEKGTGNIRIQEGIRKGQSVEGVAYEDFCKLKF